MQNHATSNTTTEVEHDPGSEDDWDAPGRILYTVEQPIQLNLRLTSGHVVSATGVCISENRPTAYRTTLNKGPIWRLASRLLRVLPALLSCTVAIWPFLALHDTLVLKRSKPGWDDEFAVELDAYRKLEPIQGVTVPILYGEVLTTIGPDRRDFDSVPNHKKRRCILISEVHGFCLVGKGVPRVDYTHLRHMLTDRLRALTSHDVSHDDVKWDNMFIVDLDKGPKARVMFIDFEVSSSPNREWVDYHIDSEVEHWLRLYCKSTKDMNEKPAFVWDGPPPPRPPRIPWSMPSPASGVTMWGGKKG